MRRQVLLIQYSILALGLALSASVAESGRETSGQDIAIVEDISKGETGLKRLDLLHPGRTIDLGGNGQLVLGYLRSCWQDSITGGRVVVEAQRSRVEGGAVVRRRVECDASGLAKISSSAVLTERAVVPLAGRDLPEPDITLFGRSPIILFKGPNRVLIIERLDIPGVPLHVETTTDRIDLQDRDINLAAKGLYRFASAAAEIIVRIDDLAEDDRMPVVGRLVIIR